MDCLYVWSEERTRARCCTHRFPVIGMTGCSEWLSIGVTPVVADSGSGGSDLFSWTQRRPNRLSLSCLNPNRSQHTGIAVGQAAQPQHMPGLRVAIGHPRRLCR